MRNTRIWHISDLHMPPCDLAAGAVPGEIPEADVAVVLGDLSGDMRANLAWCARVVKPRMPVIYVPGNHDFRHRGIIQASAEGRHLARRLGFHFLDGDAAVVAGIRFVGGTFWSDFAVDNVGYGLPVEETIRINMESCRGKADYRQNMYCEATRQVLRPEHTAAIHDRTKGFIARTLARRFEGPTVVLTHHGCLPDATMAGYGPSPVHASYTSDQRAMIETHQPDMWLFGHVHEAIDRRIGRTRIACNPRGFPDEDTGFRWDLVHTLERRYIAA